MRHVSHAAKSITYVGYSVSYDGVSADPDDLEAWSYSHCWRPMRRPPASVLGDAADGAAAPPDPRASGGAPPTLAGAKKSLGGTGSPSKSNKSSNRHKHIVS